MKYAVALFALLAAANPADATWTIVAVDPATGEVGSAGASCTPFVVGVAHLIPGRGVVVAQAASNMEAKAHAVARIRAGAAPAAIIAEVTAAAFDRDFAEQQYGIAIVRDGQPVVAAFTGARAVGAKGHRVGREVTVQGNMLVSPRVLDDAMTAYRAAAADRAPLAERLLLALEAGSRVGGDARCGRKTAQSAYLGVARPDDPPTRPSLRIIATTDRQDDRNPVAAVRARYDTR